MIRFLRRHRPTNPVLAAMYWLVLAAVTVAILFVAFFYLDNYLPGGGMF